MAELKIYRPAKGRRVRRQNGEPLPDAGEPIALTPYWQRLLADGDIEPAPQTTKSKPRTGSGSDAGSKTA